MRSKRVWDKSPLSDQKKQRFCAVAFCVVVIDSLVKPELSHKPFRKTISCTFTNTNPTTLLLELAYILPKDHIVFTIERVVNTPKEHYFRSIHLPFIPQKLLLSALLFAIHKVSSLGARLKLIPTNTASFGRKRRISFPSYSKNRHRCLKKNWQI